jgi:hypothetical protein
MKLHELFEKREENDDPEHDEFFTVEIPHNCDLFKFTDAQKYSSIWGDDEGDGSFCQNQDAVTIKDCAVKGSTVTIYPMNRPNDYDATQEKLDDYFTNWCYEQDGSYARLQLNKLPSDVKKRYEDAEFKCFSNRLTSLEGSPEYVDGDFEASDNMFTSLHNIHKIVKTINGELDLMRNPIKSSVLGLLKIKNLDRVLLDNDKVRRIINKYLPEGDIVECQSELIEAGLDEFAKL